MTMKLRRLTLGIGAALLVGGWGRGLQTAVYRCAT